MMRAFQKESLLLVLIISCLLSSTADAHGYLKSPRSRNYFAHVEGVDWGSEPGKPLKEYCPHCLNSKEATQVCGTGQTQNYDIWKDAGGNDMPWLSQDTYTEGQEIMIEAVLTTNHAGHFDVFICPNGDKSTQACFLEHPLTLLQDMLHGGPVDDHFPERAYVAPATAFKFRYRLPMGVYGSQVMMQWRYVTANSCFPPGYDRAELGLRARGWLRSEGLGDCPWPLNDTGEGAPEQFWNCAEISINPSNPTKSPSPTMEPVPTPITSNPVVSPVASPTIQVPSPNTNGCCTWDGGKSCGPTWCNDTKSNCEGSCAGTYVGSPTSPTAPSSPIAPTAPTPTTPSGLLTATTTRYWDCSGGSCGCAYLPFGPGTDSEPAHCYSNAMFRAPADNVYGAKFYGTAAISQALGGGNWLSEGCGKCWKVRGWSNIPNKDVFQTTLVLKGTNYCPPSNEPCSGNKVHFDISAPGFDVTQFSQSNTCTQREAAEIEGFESCSLWMIGNQNPDVGCDCSKFNDPVLQAGCDNFYSLLWDNPVVDYEEVDCPEELSRLSCWEQNGEKYPDGIPEFCASNIGETGPTAPAPTAPTVPTTPTAPTPTISMICPIEEIYGRTFFFSAVNACWKAEFFEDGQLQGDFSDPTCSSNVFSPTGVFSLFDSIDQNSDRAMFINGPKAYSGTFQFKESSLISSPVVNILGWKPKEKEYVLEVVIPSCIAPSESPSLIPSKEVDFGEYCCSDNLKTCTDGWCSESEINCAGCNGRWILKNPDCELKWWDDCKGNPDGCCPPSTCTDFGSYAQCIA